MKIYVIGSLRQDTPLAVAKALKAAGHEVFVDWYAAGKIADDSWRDFEKAMGHDFIEALQRPAAKNVFEFDKRWLEWAEVVVLALPAGKSGHLELGWSLGKGKPGYIILDDPERWDVMYQFATGVVRNVEELIDALGGRKGKVESPDACIHKWTINTLDTNICIKCKKIKRIFD